MTSGDAYATLLDPCNTDWSKWNYQEENIKTGQVLRSERESKPLGSVLLRGGRPGRAAALGDRPLRAGQQGQCADP